MSTGTKNIPDRLRALRSVQGWSQSELADRLGVSRNYVSMLEGGRNPSPTLEALLTSLESGMITTLPHHGSGPLKEIPGAKEEDFRRAMKLLLDLYKEDAHGFELALASLEAISMKGKS